MQLLSILGLFWNLLVGGLFAAFDIGLQCLCLPLLASYCTRIVWVLRHGLGLAMKGCAAQAAVACVRAK